MASNTSTTHRRRTRFFVYTCTVLSEESCHVTFDSGSEFKVSENVASQQNGDASVRVHVHSDQDINTVSFIRYPYLFVVAYVELDTIAAGFLCDSTLVDWWYMCCRWPCDLSVCSSVCLYILSLQVVGVLPKRLSIGSRERRHRIAYNGDSAWFPCIKDLNEIRTGSPPTRREMQVGCRLKSAIFVHCLPISHKWCNIETALIVTTEGCKTNSYMCCFE